MAGSKTAWVPETKVVRVSMIGECSAYYDELKAGAALHEPRIEFVGFSRQQVPDLLRARSDVVLLQGSSETLILDILTEIAKAQAAVKILLLSPHDHEDWLQRVIRLGVHYCLLQPVDTPTLLRRIVQLVLSSTEYGTILREQKRWATEWEVDQLLHHLGVPAHYKGFAYLKTAIAVAVDDESVLSQLTHHLYPLVAERHRVSPVHVERSIRHAIEVTCMRGDIQQIHALFAYSIDQDKGKPTNGLFIARLADHLRLRRRALPIA